MQRSDRAQNHEDKLAPEPSGRRRYCLSNAISLFLAAGLWALALVAAAAADRFIVDDEEYTARIARAGEKLAAEHRLRPVATLRRDLQKAKGTPLRMPSPARDKITPPDLYDRLRKSTLAVGACYKCPDCGQWHFDGSAGFVVADGVVCTCCHVVLGEEEDPGQEAFLVAADDAGRVFPVQSVLAADTESDTCFLKVDAPELKPLPLRSDVRPGERVYCLSHPGGNYFMFSEGMVARLNRRPNEVYDDHGHTNGLLTRPILFLNVTAEFAPGSSGAPVVDEFGNVVAQVASIADAGEPRSADTNAPASPSVPVRFCTAAEEIQRLASPAIAPERPHKKKAPTHK